MIHFEKHFMNKYERYWERPLGRRGEAASLSYSREVFTKYGHSKPPRLQNENSSEFFIPEDNTLYTPPSTVFSTFEGGLISMRGSRRSYYPHSNRISDTNHNLTPVCIRGKYYKDLLPTIFQILKIFSSLLICKCLSNFHMFCSNIKG